MNNLYESETTENQLEMPTFATPWSEILQKSIQGLQQLVGPRFLCRCMCFKGLEGDVFAQYHSQAPH